MEQLRSGLSSQTYRLGMAVSSLDEGFYRGFADSGEVVLRLAPLGTPAAAELRAEAALLERLDHPQIAKFRDRGRTDEHVFLVLDGPVERTLAELMHESDLSATAALDVAVQVVEIVAALHEAGVAWGRLRPQAFWIDKTGRLRLVNLRGAGKPVGDGKLTLAEATYLAPELSVGQTPTASGDLYACGALLYELLAGRPPFVGAGTTELAVKHLAEPAPSLKQVRPDLPDDLAALTDSCLKKMPEERPSSARALHEDLSGIRERLLEVERARMVTCPRCQGLVPPLERCPLCNALLRAEEAPAPAHKRRLLPLVAISLVSLAFLWMLTNGLANNAGAATSVPASAPTSAPSAVATPLPTREPTPIPTATAVAPPPGTLAVKGGDVPDPNIDLIRVRAAIERGSLVVDLEVAGRVEGQPGERVYQVFFDADGADAGDRSTPWRDLGADYTLLYRSSDEAAMLLRWDGTTWHGVGAATIERQGGHLALRTSADLLGNPAVLRYGALTTNPGANLADYAPARDAKPAQVGD